MRVKGLSRSDGGFAATLYTLRMKKHEKRVRCGAVPQRPLTTGGASRPYRRQAEAKKTKEEKKCSI